jgi:hypothetical protein
VKEGDEACAKADTKRACRLGVVIVDLVEKIERCADRSSWVHWDRDILVVEITSAAIDGKIGWRHCYSQCLCCIRRLEGADLSCLVAGVGVTDCEVLKWRMRALDVW